MVGTMNHKKRMAVTAVFAALACAAMLTFGICAAAPEAHAATTPLGAGTQAAPTSVNTAAAGKQIWVVSKVTSASSDDEALTFKYAYTKQGLLKKITNVTYKEANTFAYDARNRFKSMNFYGWKTAFTCDKKGRVSKTKDKKPVKYTYDAKGYLKKYVSTAQTSTYTYDKKGRLAKLVMQGYATQGYRDVYKYTYDEFGQLKSVKGAEKATIQNTYDESGRLAMQTVKSGGSETILTYSYKRVTVPKKLVKQVKAQQKSVYLEQVFSGVPIEAAYK